MHVYGLLMGKCIHARSLDEIRTPSPQQIGGLIPRDSRHEKQVSRCRSNQFRHHFSKASQTSAGSSHSFRTFGVGHPGRAGAGAIQPATGLGWKLSWLLSNTWITRAFLLASATAARL